jgi:hypothetical protein
MAFAAKLAIFVGAVVEGRREAFHPLAYSELHHVLEGKCHAIPFTPGLELGDWGCSQGL